MSAFADSSALVKLYIDEEGNETVRSLAGLVVAQVARVEVSAALWSKHRMGVLSAEEARMLDLEFKSDYSGDGDEPPRFTTTPLTNRIVEDAARDTAVHGLRAYDAVQLATARVARDIDPQCTSMTVFDKQLRAAAAAEGFALVPPE